MTTIDTASARGNNASIADSQPLIGESACMVRCRRRIDRFLSIDAPILIDGETGTGKDLAARAIHNRSLRASAPYVPVNCGALPETLVENELFGHKAGAFTDARGEQIGLVSQAGDGTLFLDEVETLSQRAQAALLRFLENHEYRPLGASNVRHCNARIIAATNVDLKTLVDRGEFRADLYYRLNILTLSMPTLRARHEDIPLLANYFLRRLAKCYARPVVTLTAETLQWMVNHDWPGNVRELENLIHREYLLCEEETLCIEDPNGDTFVADAGRVEPLPDTSDLNFREAKLKTIEHFERVYLKNLMQETRGNVTQAAAIAGKERRSLGKLMKKHAIDRSQFL